MVHDGLLTTIWFDQKEANYSAPKVRKDFLKIMGEMEIPILSISDPALIGSEMKLKFESEKITTFVQYPLKPWLNIAEEDNATSYRVMEQILKNSEQTILILHDIKYLQTSMFDKPISRKLMQQIRFFENFLFNAVDATICHSEPMKNFLHKEHGLTRVTSLGLFDYLVKDYENKRLSTSHKNTFVFAGYLGRNKKSLVEKIMDNFEKLDLPLHLYGSDFETSQNRNHLVEYRGVLNPDILPNVLAEQYLAGIIWDDLNEEQRNYYRLIAPHKASLYLCSGLPVIAPNDSYMGDFITANKIGFSLDNLAQLRDLEISWNSLDFVQLKNIGQNICSGKYLHDAILRILK